ncbi:hypothetical protein D9619_008221 [Psilocybe cf. subviscida]|uniref:Uncharacterized protein n=1 Tax=Psilocybe cf. subviscida TaxID=2480587 RepID=A0A8H5AT88_9AGAR|nr:hypothetical protein D9619_008221 [Psilocybe cf. subviscida]
MYPHTPVLYMHKSVGLQTVAIHLALVLAPWPPSSVTCACPYESLVTYPTDLARAADSGAPIVLAPLSEVPLALILILALARIVVALVVVVRIPAASVVQERIFAVVLTIAPAALLVLLRPVWACRRDISRGHRKASIELDFSFVSNDVGDALAYAPGHGEWSCHWC